MNRRYFLGAALSAAAAPVFAKKNAEKPRVLSLHHLHTDERISVTYRIGDRYQRGALAKLNHFLRDFRTGDAVAIDPQLFDLLYDVKCCLGDTGARYEVLSAYRSPQTNAMLRSTGHRVARNSLHLSGRAMDVRFSDLSTQKIRDAALTVGRGGVGYYPSANFVHLDTGTVRRWGA
ncbi:MAG: YcbK family protein [Bdellovibrio bacteriovorus]